ncbi:MAG: SDR family NAD(P)-dependent oxidoreductase [Rudaea sp.]
MDRQYTLQSNTPYTTAKHAAVGFSPTPRFEAADLGVKVRVVCPGIARTKIYDTLTVANAPRVLDIDRFIKTLSSQNARSIDPCPARCYTVVDEGRTYLAAPRNIEELMSRLRVDESVFLLYRL